MEHEQFAKLNVSFDIENSFRIGEVQRLFLRIVGFDCPQQPIEFQFIIHGTRCVVHEINNSYQYGESEPAIFEIRPLGRCGIRNLLITTLRDNVVIHIDQISMLLVY